MNKFSALTDEKKRILGEIVGGHVDTEKPGWAKRKMWWGKKIHASLYFINFFLLSLSHVHHFVSPWTAAHQASLSSLFPRVCSFLLFFLLMEMLYLCPNKKKSEYVSSSCSDRGGKKVNLFCLYHLLLPNRAESSLNNPQLLQSKIQVWESKI